MFLGKCVFEEHFRVAASKRFLEPKIQKKDVKIRFY